MLGRSPACCCCCARDSRSSTAGRCTGAITPETRARSVLIESEPKLRIVRSTRSPPRQQGFHSRTESGGARLARNARSARPAFGLRGHLRGVDVTDRRAAEQREDGDAKLEISARTQRPGRSLQFRIEADGNTNLCPALAACRCAPKQASRNGATIIDRAMHELRLLGNHSAVVS